MVMTRPPALLIWNFLMKNMLSTNSGLIMAVLVQRNFNSPKGTSYLLNKQLLSCQIFAFESVWDSTIYNNTIMHVIMWEKLGLILFVGPNPSI